MFILRCYIYGLWTLQNVIYIIFGHRKDLQYFILFLFFRQSPNRDLKIFHLKPRRWVSSSARSLFFSFSCHCSGLPGREWMRGQLHPGRGGGGRVRRRCWSDQRWSHVEGELAGAGPGTGSELTGGGDGSHRILWVKLLCWCWKYSEVQIMTFLRFKLLFVRFQFWEVYICWLSDTQSLRQLISLLNPRARERERGAAACGIMIWCVDW